ncbi:GYF domain-containing protein [Giardia muris]|uniref:GYF domain-containing protein n=1 Tax=Giardia muris TaxID=5742 RepID=A0A4Z1T8Q0_GIAMU|nr:GYF domain-containing protein [Giardia muris]|eukprot:TNJ29507.1 GYF domain-containing protein [Giardia muris]
MRSLAEVLSVFEICRPPPEAVLKLRQNTRLPFLDEPIQLTLTVDAAENLRDAIRPVNRPARRQQAQPKQHTLRREPGHVEEVVTWDTPADTDSFEAILCPDFRVQAGAPPVSVIDIADLLQKEEAPRAPGAPASTSNPSPTSAALSIEIVPGTQPQSSSPNPEGEQLDDVLDRLSSAKGTTYPTAVAAPQPTISYSSVPLVGAIPRSGQMGISIVPYPGIGFQSFVPSGFPTAVPQFPRTLVAQRELYWEYLDPTNVVRGPFSQSNMRQWYDNNQLPNTLPIRLHGYDERFIGLTDRWADALARGYSPFSIPPSFILP